MIEVCNLKGAFVKNTIKILFSLMILLLATSCVSVKKINDLEPVYVTNTKQINVLPPQHIKENVDEVMLLTADMGNEVFTTPVYVSADKDGIYMTILTDFGIEIGSIWYDGQVADMDCSMFPKNLKAVYLINEFQNGFYKSEALKKNLENSKLIFEENQKGDTIVRTVKSGNKIIENIVISKNSVEISNILRGYKITLLKSE